MKELDILEREVLKAIERCSVFTISEIKMVYDACNSFDKTIKILKHSAENKIEPSVLISQNHSSRMNYNSGVFAMTSFSEIKSRIFPKEFLELEEKPMQYNIGRKP